MVGIKIGIIKSIKKSLLLFASLSLLTVKAGKDKKGINIEIADNVKKYNFLSIFIINKTLCYKFDYKN